MSSIQGLAWFERKILQARRSGSFRAKGKERTKYQKDTIAIYKFLR
jgi:hypothetical protein